jgi:hypothetical protein
MSDTTPSLDRTWHYRFSRPGDIEIEVQELTSDEAAETYARSLSRSNKSPVIIQRLLGHVDWAYVTEVDEQR